MTRFGKMPAGRNPTMEVAITAGSVAQETPKKRKLSEPTDTAAEKPVTIDYLQGFHSPS